MNDKTREWIIDELKKDEGFVDHIYYLDNIPHIGYGYNLKANKLPAFIRAHLDAHGNITNEMSDYLLRKMMIISESDAVRHIPPAVWDKLTDKRQAVIIMMIYNMGIGHFLGFYNFLACLAENDIPGCLREMKDSEWYRYEKTHERAVRQIEYFRKG